MAWRDSDALKAICELREHGNVWALRDNPDWQQSGFALSPALPRTTGEIVDGGSPRPVQWFFDNLLPEEGSRRQARLEQLFLEWVRLGHDAVSMRGCGPS